MSNQFIPALQKTKNLFELYQYSCGISEVPGIYNFWAFLSGMASILEDRVWFEKVRGEKLYPNLYVILVGPGGLGKGTAISRAVRTVKKSVKMPIYRGKVTAAHLTDVLGKIEKDEYGRDLIANPRLWLIMDELKNDIGSNKMMAEDFVALMTEIYTASNYIINTGTRTNGSVDIENPVINWLAGSTEVWLRMVLTADLIDSGFTARTCFVFAEHDFSKRCPRIIYPADYEEVEQHIQLRLWMLQNMRGEIKMTQLAIMEEDKWYRTRPNPEDEAMYSIWKRHHDMLLKFAMLCAISDGDGMVIDVKHINMALSLVKMTEQFAGRLIEVAHENQWTKPSNIIVEMIKKKGSVKHSDALRYVRSRKGMTAKAFGIAAMSLVQEKLIATDRTDTGGLIYRWIGGE